MASLAEFLTRLKDLIDNDRVRVLPTGVPEQLTGVASRWKIYFPNAGHFKVVVDKGTTSGDDALALVKDGVRIRSTKTGATQIVTAVESYMARQDTTGIDECYAAMGELIS